MKKIWINGELVNFNQAKVHILSHSFGRGSAIFEVISTHRTEKGVAIFRLSDHLERLKRSAGAIYLRLPYSKSELTQAVKETVKANQIGNGIIKILAYLPEFSLEVAPTEKKLSVAIAGFDFERDISLSKFGEDKFARAGISSWRKLHPSTVPVFAKASGNYLNPMLAKLEVKKRGFSAPILLDTKGYVAEGATESIFIVKNKKLFTPRLDNILPSITRMSILEIAFDLGIKVVQKRLKPNELFSCDEAFFSSTTCKVWPICQIENHKLPAPGAISQQLKDYFDQILALKIKKFSHWLSPV